ncbi:hypothetical protein TEQG_08632 [Trichophyton equinum CBS 127.97]|uniref:Uncharacterized protein n=1 Tax=Trichophyton equinum (strain ATCC MYA-4606 / CBS 127.97) TaxID=559882 RepID=F2PNI2_TRIEC|nr:hypothetical protein TEQG_08632 [Trichophyton equinum CBS 127.97]
MQAPYYSFDVATAIITVCLPGRLIPDTEIKNWIATDPDLHTDLSAIAIYFSQRSMSFEDILNFFSYPYADTYGHTWRTSVTVNQPTANLPQSPTKREVEACMRMIKGRLAQNIVDVPLDGVCSYCLILSNELVESNTPDWIECYLYLNQEPIHWSSWQRNEKEVLPLGEIDTLPHQLSILLWSAILRCPVRSVMLTEMHSEKLHIVVVSYGASGTSGDLYLGQQLGDLLINTSYITPASQRLKVLNDRIRLEYMDRLDKYMGPSYNARGKELVDLYLKSIFEC